MIDAVQFAHQLVAEGVVPDVAERAAQFLAAVPDLPAKLAAGYQYLVISKQGFGEELLTLARARGLVAVSIGAQVERGVPRAEAEIQANALDVEKVYTALLQRQAVANSAPTN